MEDKKAITLRGSCHHAQMTYDPSWLDPTSAWWAKANRAQHHVRSLGQQVEAFRASTPYTVVPQATDTPGRTEYRLRVHQPMPVEISTTVGDVLHNLRSALDSLAYEIARRGLDRPMTIEEEEACAFPWRHAGELRAVLRPDFQDPSHQASLRALWRPSSCRVPVRPALPHPRGRHPPRRRGR